MRTEAVPRNPGEVLRTWARLRPDRIAYRFLVDGESSETLEITYAELDRRARAIAVALLEFTAAGEPVVLLFPPGLDFIAAFLGCLYAGAIAVPTYPPTHRSIAKLNAILSDSGATLVLTSREGRERFLTYSTASGDAAAHSHLRYLATDEIGDDCAATWTDPNSGPETLAFLQYTSGSTSTPRGVMVTNGNLVHQEEALLRAFDNDPTYDWVSWLPFYHDMGLIAGVLQPLYIGTTCTLLAPVAFVQRPSRWLEAISRYRANVSGAPDFAYDLCADKVTAAQKAGLDLSCWHVAFNGAEPVRARSHSRFAEAFAPCGFRGRSLFPIYGLAESTLVVTAGHIQDFSSPVSCGFPIGDAKVVIANPDTLARCAPGETGELLVSSGSVAKGYWKRPEHSAAVFGAYLAGTGEGPFLRTGDLAFERDSQFYIGSRIKDLIIIRGVNHSPQDIEFTVSGCDPALRGGMEAAFSVDADGVEQLVVVKELSRENLRKVDAPGALAAIREAISLDHGIEVGAILLVKPNVLPRTTSGKVQRRQCVGMFLEDVFEPVARYDRPKPAAVPEAVASHPGTLADSRQWLLSKLSGMFGIDASAIDIREPLTRYGIGSLQAVQLSGEMETAFGRRIAPTIVWEFPTVDGLAHYLSGVPLSADRARTVLQEPIAIVGMACRFPGAADPDAFWDLLINGREQITEVGEDRWDIERFYDPDPDAPGKTISRRGGFLPRVDLFDAEFFGISPREASAMDPQQRLLLEVSWEALERAGQSPERLAGSRTGVFGGISFGDYSSVHWNSGDPTRVDSFAGTGSMFSIAMGRISYALGLRGPNMAIDTACSSSLVSVHMACQSLRQGECDLALAGGVNLMIAPEPGIFLSKSHALAPDGRCKAFDTAADGYVRGEGCGMIVLRRLSDALAAKDNILAVVRSSAINHDGRSNGLTAPSGTAQQEVIREAVERAGVDPGDVSYVETHGTGTPLGDPIEARALAAVLRPGSAMPLLIGSVKTNIGHLEAAAGVAGLIKTVLALGHGRIPAHLHFHEMNPHIGSDVPVRVPTSAEGWPGRRLAGVSSFGFSGTNAHVIVEEAPRVEVEAGTERGAHILALSARTPEALRDLIDLYRQSLTVEPASLADFCYTANTGRSHFAYRAAAWGGNASEILQRLPIVTAPPVRGGISVAFLFSGQGAQRAGMARGLYETQPVFREALDRCAEIEPKLLDVLYGSVSGEIDQTEHTQPALFAIEWALAQMWQSWGIRPSAVLGHSVGEFVAACVAGAMDWKDGLRLVLARGRLMQSLPAGGEMWAVQATEAEVRALAGAEVGIAAINASRSVVISGARNAVRAVAVLLGNARQLSVSHAFHSPLMEPILDEMERLASAVEYKPTNIAWISGLTGCEMTGVLNARYWRDQLRETVRFADGIQCLRSSGVGVYIEMGPDPVLLGAARQDSPADDSALWFPALRKDRDDWDVTLETLASLYQRGAEIDWIGFDKPWARRKVALPTYPFQRQRYWMDRQPRASVPLYSVRWTPLPQATSAPDYSGRWLILMDRGGFGHDLADRLRQRGAECEVAEYGATFQAAGKRVVHLWAFEAAVDAQETALGGLVESIRQGPERVWAVTCGAQLVDGDRGMRNIAQTPIWGLGKVAALEHPDLWGGLIDIDERTTASLDALIAQLGRDESEHVALRRGARYASSLERMEAALPTETRFDGAGTYLITGGTGAIGQLLVAYLKSRGAKNVIAVGRALDVSNRSAVRGLVESLPDLRGVIHAAGELFDGVLLNQKSFDRALAAKALGAWNLHEATADRMLDFFILFSSVTSLEGMPGQGSYAAANAFLDGLAAYRHQLGLPALSINWGPWAATGMAANLTGDKDPGSIDPAAALFTFGLLMRHTAAQVAVLPDRLLEKIRNARRREAKQIHPRDIRRFVEAETLAVLGMDASQLLDWRQPLRDCGLNSLLAVELRNRLAAGLNRALPPDLLFHYSSVESLAGFLSETASPKPKQPAQGAPPAHEPIAIVGMGCRFPLAENPDAFWRLLRRGGCAITEVPPDRWDPDVWYDPDLSRPGTMNTRWGGFLDNPDLFDPNFFGISHREACGMDPQQRLLLEVVWEALENAGQAPERLAGSETGVFIGISSSDYGALLIEPPQRGSTGVAPSVAASRISYVLDFQGPGMAVDTACSSSLVAVDLACHSLRGGRCDLAVAGGVNIILCPDTTVSIAQAGMMAPDGLCKTFDASADGYVRSEGCGIVVLKRLSDAMRNRDPILAVLRGTAVLQDGRSNGLTAPNALAQQKLIRHALSDAGVTPEQIGFVEAHGTGTSLGDVVEVGSLAAVLGHAGDEPCYLGSLKTNMGHLEAAAGIAGVIKTVLTLQHEEIPQQINLKQINPKLDLADNRLRIDPGGRAWRRGDEPRFAGVSSFGFGGTIAHAVIEEAPMRAAVARPQQPEMFVLSARSETALRRLALRYVNYLEDGCEAQLSDICFTAAAGRNHWSHRLTVSVASKDELRDELAGFAAGSATAARRRTVQLNQLPRLAFFLPDAQEGLLETWAGLGIRPEAVNRDSGWKEGWLVVDPRDMPGTLAELYLNGFAIDWDAFYRDEERLRVALPTYPFERRRCWLEPSEIKSWGVESRVHSGVAGN
jgi:acyl transferase domain-containing protein/acyl-CoA synthetase (AMP-forming)/AMP-acid ligase II/acyl carrier protein